QCENGSEKKINATYFDITEFESRQLHQNGQNAAREFLRFWDFENWKKQYKNMVAQRLKAV
ncbi:MAG: hypothetical protein LBU94_06130, partial [Clostridiales bacterium]|nr:hypothetical protein [Clostridiales bacterium]